MEIDKHILGHAYGIPLGDLRMLVDLDRIHKNQTYRLGDDLELLIREDNLFNFIAYIKIKKNFCEVKMKDHYGSFLITVKHDHHKDFKEPKSAVDMKYLHLAIFHLYHFIQPIKQQTINDYERR